jgi:glycosyltransferase involved in cell wall biosynthesis
MQPVVSILLPAYRAEATIMEAVRSALEGAAGAVEVLVESDDGTDYGEVAGLPGVRVANTGVVRSGPGATRNRALARARGAFVLCLDADDVLGQGWLASALPMARATGAAALALEVEEAGALILRLWQGQERLSLADMAASGASAHALVARGRFPESGGLPSQDILQMVQVLARWGGSVPLAPVPYRLRLGQTSVTAAADFSARVQAAYVAHIATLEGDAGLAPDMARAAADVFRAKKALNEAYMRDGAGRSYYRFIADRMAESGSRN